MAYTTNDIRTIYNVAPETVRNWTREFARYLSPMANPETGRTRMYTEDDMKVFDLVNRMRNEAKPYEEIHLALIAGQRGNLPNMTPEEVRAIIIGETERRMSTEIQMLRRQLAEAESRLAGFESLKTTSIRLEADLAAEKRRAEEFAAQLREAQTKLESLYREVGRAYHQGYVDALKRDEGDGEGD